MRKFCILLLLSLCLIGSVEVNAQVREIAESVNHSADEPSQDWVDLGLPSGTMWATKNVGAKQIDESGSYLTWRGLQNVAGNGWTVPSDDQFNELVKYCDWQWTTINGHEGYIVRSKKNPHNSMFLPAAGYYNDSNSSRLQYASNGRYWTRTRNPYYNGDAYYFHFFQGFLGEILVFNYNKLLSVRLVVHNLSMVKNQIKRRNE